MGGLSSSLSSFLRSSRESEGRFAFLVFALVIGILCCQTRDTTLPVDLFGVWRTTAKEYEDRFFELTSETLRIRTGEANVDIFVIWNINKTPEERRTLYEISYLDDIGEESIFSFHYEESDGVVVFANQPSMLWVKEEQ